MKSHITYTCEFCHEKFRYVEKCEKHEATHYGLTYSEYQKWRHLRNVAKNAGLQASLYKNPVTDDVFDEAVRALVNFEKEHGLTNKKAPSNWC